MGICISCEKPFEQCQCGKAAQKRLRELIAEEKAKKAAREKPDEEELVDIP